MALKCWLGTGVAPREFDPEYSTSSLEPGLLPEERDEATDLDEGDDAVINVDGLLSLGKVGHVAFVVHATHIEPVVADVDALIIYITSHHLKSTVQ